RSLKPSDRFNVLLFAGSSSFMAPHSLPATSGNLEQALYLIDRQEGGGGTELLPALKRVLAMPKDEGFSPRVVVITDGYVDIETESFDLIRKGLGKGNLFSFGIGSSINRFLIEGLARAGGGEPFVATNPTEAKLQARAFKEYIDSPVLSNIAVSFEGFDAYDLSREVLPDLFAAKPVVQFGKWRGAVGGKIVITGRRGAEPFRQEIDLREASSSPDNRVLRYLWARDKIAELSDYVQLARRDETKAKITNLGLTYNLLTRFTSFIAVDHIVRAAEPGT